VSGLGIALSESRHRQIIQKQGEKKSERRIICYFFERMMFVAKRNLILREARKKDWLRAEETKKTINKTNHRKKYYLK
jgi:hypothetical protein